MENTQTLQIAFDLDKITIAEAREAFSADWRSLYRNKIILIQVVSYTLENSNVVTFTPQFQMGGVGKTLNDSIAKLIAAVNGLYVHHLISGTFPVYERIEGGMEILIQYLKEKNWQIDLIKAELVLPTLVSYVEANPAFKNDVMTKYDIKGWTMDIEIPALN